MNMISARNPAKMASDSGFFLWAAIAMAGVIVAGFSVQLAMGRSTFSSPPLVHLHAIIFMGWVLLYLLQNISATTRRMALHRRLGWVAPFWMVAMLILGVWVTVAMARRGQVPFFFQPLHFLVFDPVALVTFAGLTAAAIAMRRRTDWHRRLHFCGMCMLLGPGFGRLLPMPLLQPWAWEATFAATMIFPIIGVTYDVRRHGYAHPAWRWGIATMVGSMLLVETITYSPLGLSLYRAATAGAPGASVPPLDFAAPSAGPLRTERTVIP